MSIIQHKPKLLFLFDSSSQQDYDYTQNQHNTIQLRKTCTTSYISPLNNNKQIQQIKYQSTTINHKQNNLSRTCSNWRLNNRKNQRQFNRKMEGKLSNKTQVNMTIENNINYDDIIQINLAATTNSRNLLSPDKKKSKYQTQCLQKNNFLNSEEIDIQIGQVKQMNQMHINEQNQQQKQNQQCKRQQIDDKNLEYIQKNNQLLQTVMGLMEENITIKRDLLDCNNQILMKSVIFINDISLKSNTKVLTKFCKFPIPKNIRLQFIIYRSKNIFGNSYEMWLKIGHNKQNRILIAEKTDIQIEKTTFSIRLAHCSLQSIIGKIVSNANRRQYNLYIDNDKEKKLLGTSYKRKIYNNQQKVQLYIPKFQNNNYEQIFAYSNQSLCYFAMVPLIRQKIDLFRSVQISQNNRNKLFKQYNIIQYKKNLLIGDRYDNQIMYFGKVSSNKYKVIVGEQLNPLQIFLLAIMQMEN